MDRTDSFLQSGVLQDSEDMDALLELAELVRELIGSGQCEAVGRIIRHTVAYSRYEAFSWCAALLQEELEKPEGALCSFACDLGSSIPDYDAFAARLQVDFRAVENGIETECDSGGEVKSFFNILTYRTGYPNIYLTSAENFDAKDNDYVQYALHFERKEKMESR